MPPLWQAVLLAFNNVVGRRVLRIAKEIEAARWLTQRINPVAGSRLLGVEGVIGILKIHNHAAEN
ncbi:MAG: hypothetical protein JW395_0328 [Nitrospira sp.]|nr:hypothetical protein [Nitrospira sp.]